MASNVILLMWDGIRHQELFGGTDPSLLPRGMNHLQRDELMPFFWNHFVPNGVLYGDPTSSSHIFHCSNKYMLSLPGYQSIMAGVTQPAKDNHSGYIQVETLQESLVSKLALKEHEVASFASWHTMLHAIHSVHGGEHFANCGIEAYVDPKRVETEGDATPPLSDFLSEIVRKMMMEKGIETLNREQQQSQPPWHNARFDKYTNAFALHYLTLHHPRFMFLSFNDSDDMAHFADYEGYINAIRQYDKWLQILMQILSDMGEYGKNTTVIVTTDHGRGEGAEWVDHGGAASMLEAKPVWLAASGPYTIKQGTLLTHSQHLRHVHIVRDQEKRHPDLHTGKHSSKKRVHSHLDIRPTIEYLMGIKPKNSPFHGKVLPEVAHMPSLVEDVSLANDLIV